MRTEEEIRAKCKLLKRFLKGRETPNNLKLVICLAEEIELETLKWVLNEEE